jgi:hypothetical protein
MSHTEEYVLRFNRALLIAVAAVVTAVLFSLGIFLWVDHDTANVCHLADSANWQSTATMTYADQQMVAHNLTIPPTEVAGGKVGLVNCDHPVLQSQLSSELSLPHVEIAGSSATCVGYQGVGEVNARHRTTRVLTVFCTAEDAN